MCHLAENAGRLVSKRELHDAVWGNVAVSDDALVQCIRELRLKLGDTDRMVIRTVPRRGYLLNARKELPEVAVAATLPPDAAAMRALPRPWYVGAPARWAATTLVVALVLALTAFPVAKWVSPPPRDLVSVEDARHLAKLAAEKELPLPAFHITSRAEDVPDAIRRFVGVWVSDTGWRYSDRQLMVIVTSVTKGGRRIGIFREWAIQAVQPYAGPAFMMTFKGHINAGTMRYDGYVGMYLANLDPEGSMEFKLIFRDGVTTAAKLKPIWTLPKGGESESAERAGGAASAFARL